MKVQGMVWMVCMVLWLFPCRANAAVHGICLGTVTGEHEWSQWLDDFDSAEIEAFLNSLQEKGVPELSFGEIMEELLAGNLMGVFERGAEMVKTVLFSELRTNSGLLGQIVILAVIDLQVFSVPDMFQRLVFMWCICSPWHFLLPVSFPV